MDAKDLVQLNPKDIRKSNELMRLYIELYKGAFLVKPNCAGCTFTKDFNKLKKHIQSGKTIHEIKITDMAEFKLKKQYNNEILTYKVGKRPFRTYGKLMTSDFAEAFLANATKEEYEQRKDMFESLPKKNESDYSDYLEDMSRKDLDKMGEDLGLIVSEYKNKGEIIEAIKNHK